MYIEGNLNVKEKEEIKKHLDECVSCNSLYNDFLLILENSKKIKIPQLNENLLNALKVTIEKNKISTFSLKPVYIAISIFVLVFSTIFFARIYLPDSKKVLPVSTGPVKIEILNHELPFSEDVIIKYANYMEEEEVEKVLDFIFAGL